MEMTSHMSTSIELSIVYSYIFMLLYDDVTFYSQDIQIGALIMSMVPGTIINSELTN